MLEEANKEARKFVRLEMDLGQDNSNKVIVEVVPKKRRKEE